MLESLRPELLPADLGAVGPSDRAATWADWVAQRDQAVRARLERGDRDSIVNFLIFGSSFTKRPRASGDDFAALAEQPSRVSPLLKGRADDLAAAVASPGGNERLQIARAMLLGLGIDPSSIEGRARAVEYLIAALQRAPGELTTYAQEVAASPAAGGVGQMLTAHTAFRDRGLSSDTSIVVNAALDRAFVAMKARGAFGSAGVRRVAIVGPGLDFTDKHDGHDFYPIQTIQPFAVLDSLVRHDLARLDALNLTALDVSPRILRHIEGARQRAAAGQGYVVNLPRNMRVPWGPALAAFWDGFGRRIGTPAAGAPIPKGVGQVRVQSTRVRPSVVRAIDPQDVNIVFQRIELPPEGRFDLIVATDVLVYYDVFEQSLALANIASMLRPGGLLVTNNQIFELPALPMDAAGSIDVVHMTMPIVGDIRDRVIWYRRR